MPKLYKTRVDHSTHACEIRQLERKFNSVNIGLLNLPDDSARIYYQMWCLECNKPVATISHDEAWRAYCNGAPFGPLKTKIKNSRYKQLERKGNQS